MCTPRTPGARVLQSPQRPPSLIPEYCSTHRSRTVTPNVPSTRVPEGEIDRFQSCLDARHRPRPRKKVVRRKSAASDVPAAPWRWDQRTAARTVRVCRNGPAACRKGKLSVPAEAPALASGPTGRGPVTVSKDVRRSWSPNLRPGLATADWARFVPFPLAPAARPSDNSNGVQRGTGRSHARRTGHSGRQTAQPAVPAEAHALTTDPSGPQ